MLVRAGRGITSDGGRDRTAATSSPEVRSSILDVWKVFGSEDRPNLNEGRVVNRSEVGELFWASVDVLGPGCLKSRVSDSTTPKLLIATNDTIGICPSGIAIPSGAGSTTSRVGLTGPKGHRDRAPWVTETMSVFVIGLGVRPRIVLISHPPRFLLSPLLDLTAHHRLGIHPGQGLLLEQLLPATRPRRPGASSLAGPRHRLN